MNDPPSLCGENSSVKAKVPDDAPSSGRGRRTQRRAHHPSGRRQRTQRRRAQGRNEIAGPTALMLSREYLFTMAVFFWENLTIVAPWMVNKCSASYFGEIFRELWKHFIFVLEKNTTVFGEKIVSFAHWIWDQCLAFSEKIVRVLVEKIVSFAHWIWKQCLAFSEKIVRVLGKKIVSFAHWIWNQCIFPMCEKCMNMLIANMAMTLSIVGILVWLCLLLWKFWWSRPADAVTENFPLGDWGGIRFGIFVQQHAPKIYRTGKKNFLWVFRTVLVLFVWIRFAVYTDNIRDDVDFIRNTFVHLKDRIEGEKISAICHSLIALKDNIGEKLYQWAEVVMFFLFLLLGVFAWFRCREDGNGPFPASLWPSRKQAKLNLVRVRMENQDIRECFLVHNLNGFFRVLYVDEDEILRLRSFPKLTRNQSDFRGTWGNFDLVWGNFLAIYIIAEILRSSTISDGFRGELITLLKNITLLNNVPTFNNTLRFVMNRGSNETFDWPVLPPTSATNQIPDELENDIATYHSETRRQTTIAKKRIGRKILCYIFFAAFLYLIGLWHQVMEVVSWCGQETKNQVELLLKYIQWGRG